MMKKWKVRPSDVLLATPAKSGTTWMSEILLQMREFHPMKSEVEKDEYQVPYAEMGTPLTPSAMGRLDQLPDPRVIKTHLYYEFFEQKVEQEGLKVVVVLREPKDTLTSYYHHYCLRMMGSFPGDFHQFFELFRNDRLMGGNIFKMASGWWTKRDLPNVHIVKYEEMKKDCAGVIRGLGKFLEIPLEEEVVTCIVEKCKIENMRKSKVMDFIVDSQGQKVFEPEKFFRKGVVGDWRTHMTEEEAAFVDGCAQEYFEPIGLNFNV
ncbi:hypothetical protein CAPTEDRAFT_199727 [Capitella teleta]|uniref:Sulfotransferase domain-containing protein n=1 Tax=Capitella teleta TaxID=283909 RepID=R7VBB5_CAPTE|nr:hypothetical protein CAPTEDRAFT_199727 [Capitella teleta]|eukprot:ELU12995.1 hypothetical protein CAPTEDRAFT_199727 [Capitella teleta]